MMVSGNWGRQRVREGEMRVPFNRPATDNVFLAVKVSESMGTGRWFDTLAIAIF